MAEPQRFDRWDLPTHRHTHTHNTAIQHAARGGEEEGEQDTDGQGTYFRVIKEKLRDLSGLPTSAREGFVSKHITLYDMIRYNGMGRGGEEVHSLTPFLH